MIAISLEWSYFIEEDCSCRYFYKEIGMGLREHKDRVSVYTTPHYAAYFDLGRLKSRIVSLPLQDMAKQFMAGGNARDICIMPFVSRYKSLLSTFRAKGRFGPVIFVSEEAVDAGIAYDVHKNGAFFLDARNQDKDFFLYLILFLIHHGQLNPVVSSKSETEELTETLHRAYYRQPENLAVPDKSDANEEAGKDLRDVLAEAFEQPEVIPFDTLYEDSGFSETNFSFTFDVVTQKDNKKVTFSCMASLHHIDGARPVSRKRMLFFHKFHPDFSFKLLQQKALSMSREDRATLFAMKKGGTHAHAVECIFGMGGLNRACLMVPAATLNEEQIGFIPVSDALIQSRQFFRIEPSVHHPIRVLVSSMFCPTQDVRIIDVSEKGISFFSHFLFKKNSEIRLYLTWEKTQILGKGIVRFAMEDEASGPYKIGVELYLHQDESAKLRKYVFNCQIDIMNALRKDYA